MMGIFDRERILLLLCILFLVCTKPCCSHTDTLLQGQTIKDGEYLVSANAVFQLRFFSTISSPDQHQYLGILYNSPSYDQGYPSEEDVVWIANRDNPIPCPLLGSLGIDNINGSLKLSCSGGGPVLFSAAANSSNTSATLLDNGNFVLREVNPSDGSPGVVVWQSFDYPTHALIPGMRIGINFKTGHQWSLTSWRYEDSPASGSYTLGVDSNANGTDQLFIRFRGKIHWTSGPWNGSAFEFLDPLRSRRDKYGGSESLLYENFIKYDFVSNEEEKYFTIQAITNLTNALYYMSSGGTFAGSGGLNNLVDRCGRYGSGGCVGSCSSNTTSGRSASWDSFSLGMGYMSGEGMVVDGGSNMSLDDCQYSCLTNCSCAAFASTSPNGTGCEIWGPGPTFTYSESARYIYYVFPNEGQFMFFPSKKLCSCAVLPIFRN